MARLLFLGRLEDLAGAADLVVPLAAPTPLPEVVAGLNSALREALSGPRIRLARNGELVSADGLIVAEGDELAFLPPVSGG
jgi:molybdopterin synthase sulfur carrier subunit